ncbi:Uncharacterised protein [Mycobacteroides abscessus subsp. abscessus]|nr:Uncharacterised protein [Mycobacteroides abscessus subsp. abscessus]
MPLFGFGGLPAERAVREAGQRGQRRDPRFGQLGDVGAVEQGRGEPEARPQPVVDHHGVHVHLGLQRHAGVFGRGQLAEVVGGQPAQALETRGDVGGGVAAQVVEGDPAGQPWRKVRCGVGHRAHRRAEFGAARQRRVHVDRDR